MQGISLIVATSIVGASTLTGCSSLQPTGSAVDATAASAPLRTDVRAIVDLAPEQATFTEDASLSQAQVLSRQAVIDSEYGVGERLSSSDAEFIRMYADPISSTTPAHTAQDVADVHHSNAATSARTPIATLASTNSFHRFNSGAGGSGTVGGSQTMDYSDNPFNITGHWSARWRASGSVAVTSITATEHVRVYGLIGGSGIGVAYAADPSGTVNGRINEFSRSDTFTAYGAYSTMNYDATFFTATGSFNITGK